MFVAVYFLFLLVSRSFFDPAIVFFYRILSPIFVALLVIAAWLMFRVMLTVYRRGAESQRMIEGTGGSQLPG